MAINIVGIFEGEEGREGKAKIRNDTSSSIRRCSFKRYNEGSEMINL